MLTLTYIKLTNFAGMMLNGVSTFEYNINKVYNLILGRNGCGKSELYRALSIAALNKTKFIEFNGSRVLRWVFNNVPYEATNDCVEGTLRNTLIRTDTNEVLLDGVNNTVYNTYISEHFSYNTQLHELRIGKLKLTNMKKEERKYWFSLLSESDLNYAIKFYQKAKKSLRDITGGIVSTNLTISELKPTVMNNEAALEQVTARIAELQEDIVVRDKLLADLAGENITEEDFKRLDSEIEAINDEIMHMSPYVPVEIYGYTKEQIQANIIANNTIYKSYLAKLEELKDRLDKVNRLSATTDIISLESRLIDLNRDIEEYSNEIVLFPDLKKHANVVDQNFLGSFTNFILDIISTLGHMSSTSLPLTNLADQLNSRINSAIEIQEKLNRISNRQYYIDERIVAITHAEKITCEKCTHSWIPGVKPNELEELKALNITLTTEKNQLNIDLERINNEVSFYSQARVCLDAYRDGLKLHRSNPIAIMVHDYIVKTNCFIESPGTFQGIFRQFITELEFSNKIYDCYKVMEGINNNLAILKASTNEDDSKLSENIEDILKKMDQLITDNDTSKRRLDIFAQYERTMARYDVLEERLNDLVHRKVELGFDLYCTDLRNLLVEERDELWQVLLEAKSRYEEYAGQKLRLQIAEEDHAKLTKRKEIVEHIVRGMSPDEGILAIHLYNAITKITESMSKYIELMWSYRMQILPCDISTGELDYKFPFWVVDPSKEVPDVSAGSLGQMEVIDLVFPLTADKALNLEGYPLFIDEIGKTFSEDHKVAMISLFKRMIEGGKYSQLFMISHDPATHYQLSTADVVIIDPVGITLPTSYNQSVVIA